MIIHGQFGFNCPSGLEPLVFYPALVLFEQSHCIDRIIFCYIWSLTDSFLAPDSC
jgi:hypothetical protein